MLAGIGYVIGQLKMVIVSVQPVLTKKEKRFIGTKAFSPKRPLFRERDFRALRISGFPINVYLLC